MQDSRWQGGPVFKEPETVVVGLAGAKVELGLRNLTYNKKIS